MVSIRNSRLSGYFGSVPWTGRRDKVGSAAHDGAIDNLSTRVVGAQMSTPDVG